MRMSLEGLIVIEKQLSAAKLLGSRDLRPPLGHSKSYRKVCVSLAVGCLCAVGYVTGTNSESNQVLALCIMHFLFP